MVNQLLQLLSVRRDMRLVGKSLGVEITSPTTASTIRIMTTATNAVFMVFMMMRVSHHLVGDMLLMAEQFLQTYYCCQHQGELQKK